MTVLPDGEMGDGQKAQITPWSTTVYVLSSELGPPTPSPASECVPLRYQRGEVVGVPFRTTCEKAWPSVYSVGVE
jgi:hypothetical protein